MKKYTALIVDDEKVAREILSSYLQKYCTQIDIIGEAESIIVAKELITKKKPDILFLDIEMPFGNAFDLLEELSNVDFEIIFITAFNEYALQALNMSAVHYLLKPIDIDDLVIATEKAITTIDGKSQISNAKILIENLKNIEPNNRKVVLPELNGFSVRKVKEVLYCAAQENFTQFHFTDKTTALICRKLKHYEKLLTPIGFCRIHRSTLVNLEYVKKYVKGRGGQVILENGTTLDVSESRKAELVQAFKP